MEVQISDWQLICELERRIEARDIFRAKNGKLWPRFCPACGGTITEYGVEVNYTPKELQAFNFVQWRGISKELTDKEALNLPVLPFRESGKFYYVRCDNADSWAQPCPVHNFEWFRDLDDARRDFFDNATE